MSDTTIRGMVRTIQQEIAAGGLDPHHAADLLMKLTAVLGNCNDEIRLADAHYAIVLLRCLDSDEAVNRAKIRAETSPEYQRRREARDTKELAQEMIGALGLVAREPRAEYGAHEFTPPNYDEAVLEMLRTIADD